MNGNLVDDLLPGANAAAAFTGLTSRTIYHMVERGELPVIRKGRRLYFRRSELERAFQSGCNSEETAKTSEHVRIDGPSR